MNLNDLTEKPEKPAPMEFYHWVTLVFIAGAVWGKLDWPWYWLICPIWFDLIAKLSSALLGAVIIGFKQAYKKN